MDRLGATSIAIMMSDWLIDWLGQMQGEIVRTLAAEPRAGGIGTVVFAFALATGPIAPFARSTVSASRRKRTRLGLSIGWSVRHFANLREQARRSLARMLSQTTGEQVRHSQKKALENLGTKLVSNFAASY